MNLLLVLDIMCNMAELQIRKDKKIADAIIEKEYDREYKDIQIPRYAMEDALDFFDIKVRYRIRTPLYFFCLIFCLYISIRICRKITTQKNQFPLFIFIILKLNFL